MRALRMLFLLLSAAPVWAGSADYADMVMSDGPSTYLRFEEGLGSTLANSADWAGWDFSVGKDYTLTGSPGYSKASPFADTSKAMGFGGSTCAYSNAGTADDTALDVFVRDWTLEFWIRRTTLAQSATVFSKNGRISVAFTSNALTVTPLAAAGCSIQGITTTISDTKWHHVALVADYAAQTFTHYLDGAQSAQLTSCQYYMFPQANTTTAIGSAGADSCSSASSMELDELATYAHPLSATRIAEHYRARQSCYLSSTGQFAACTPPARGVLAIDSAGKVGAFSSRFLRTVELGTAYAYDGTDCTAPALQKIGGTGPRQWVGRCASTTGEIEFGMVLPRSFVAGSGVRVTGYAVNHNAAPVQHTFSVFCACAPSGGSETTWSDTSAFPPARFKSSSQDKVAVWSVPATACYPTCNPGNILRLRLKPGTWTQDSDQDILGFAVGLSLHATGDY